jgi:hypothetical protein
VTHIGDVDIGDVTTQEVRDYLAWLRTEYKPHRWKKSDDPSSPKTLRNTWVTLSAFFRWASIELDVPNPMKAVPGLALFPLSACCANVLGFGVREFVAPGSARVQVTHSVRDIGLYGGYIAQRRGECQ